VSSLLEWGGGVPDHGAPCMKYQIAETSHSHAATTADHFVHNIPRDTPPLK